MAEALGLAWRESKLLEIGVEVTPMMLMGGSSCDEKSELSNVESDTHSSK